MKLTPSQIEAINTIDQNLQIVACAGSGKTQVVSERIINILENGYASPSEIVAFTYTEKAAAELKHRVLSLARERLGSVEGMAEMYIGTIHSWCMHYLQEYSFGYQKYSVLNDVRLKLFIDQRNRKVGMNDLKVVVQGEEKSLVRYRDTGIFLSVLSIARECELNSGHALPNEVKETIKKYEQELDKHAYFDFTMILTRFLADLRENEATKNRISSSLKYLIVDEYQDVNYIQESIIKELSSLGVKLCVVGDDDQTIYQWRGSSLENILNFSHKYYDVKKVTLDDNFRSSQGIIEVAHSVVSEISPNKRLVKAMKASGHQKYELSDIQYEIFNSYEAEEKFIIEQIKNLRGKSFKDRSSSDARGLDFSDMAILLRKWKSATQLSEALRAAEIPYVVTGVSQLFEQQEVDACVNIFRFIAKQIDRSSLIQSWINVAPLIKNDRLAEAVDYLEKIIPDNSEWHEYFILQKVFKEFREFAMLTESTVGKSTLNGMPLSEVVFYNMGMFSQVIEDFEVIHFKDRQKDKLENFLNFLKYSAKDYYPEGWLNKSLVTPNAITITSIHQSKGLEWPVVFIPRMNKNYFPAKPTGGLNAWHILQSDSIKNYDGIRGTKEDELRLFYVALTRSKKFLFVTRAPGASNQDKKPSEFLDYIRSTPYIFRAPGYDFSDRQTSPLRDVREISNILLNFSLLEAFYNCPYSFKYYTLYGFKEPLNPRMGYGKSIHDALMEIHRRAMEGAPPDRKELIDLVDRHVHFPYAIQEVKDDMKDKAISAVTKYYDNYLKEFERIHYAEKDIEIDLGDGVIVNGRMDLIKKRELNGEDKTYIVDFKSQYKEDRHAVGIKQLLLYALGYKELTGETADFLQIYDFATSKEHNNKLNNRDLDEAEAEILSAADKIRGNDFNERCGKKGCPCRFQK